jgi:hypothetical protein
MEGIAPEAILRRPGKARFDQFVVEALRGPDNAALHDLLGQRAHVRAYLPPAWGADLAEPPHDGLVRWASRAFRAAAVEAWLRELAEPGAGQRFAERHGLVMCEAEFAG